MLSKFFDPVVIDGHKFDRGSILYEFDALREPERTQFPQIGEWVKQRIEMNRIPTPSMYWRGKFWPDLIRAMCEIDCPVESAANLVIECRRL